MEELKGLPVEIQERVFKWFCLGVHRRRLEWVIARHSLIKTTYDCDEGFLRQSICGRHYWRSELRDTALGRARVFAHLFRYYEEREPESHIVFAYDTGEIVYNGKPDGPLVRSPAPWKGSHHLELIESNKVGGFRRRVGGSVK